MDEKKLLKMNIATVIFVMIVIIVVSVIATAYTFSRFYDANIAEQAKIIRLNEAINRLETRNNELMANLSNDEENKTEKPKEETLTEEKKQAIFKKINAFEGDFLNTMIDEKDYSEAKFSDYEIVSLLPKIELNKFKKSFVDNNVYAGSIATASTNVIQLLANKYFGRSVTLNNLKTQNAIIFNADDTISIGIGEGYVSYKYDLISVNSIEENTYDVTFKCTKEDNTANDYVLRVRYREPEISFLFLKKQ